MAYLIVNNLYLFFCCMTDQCRLDSRLSGFRISLTDIWYVPLHWGSASCKNYTYKGQHKHWKNSQIYFHNRREIRNHDPSAGAIGINIRQKPCSHFVHNLSFLFSTISKRTSTRQFSVPFCHYKHFLAFLVKQIPCLSPHPLSKPNFHILQCPIAISVLLAPCPIFLRFLTSSACLNINIFFKYSKAYDNIARPEKLEQMLVRLRHFTERNQQFVSFRLHFRNG